MISPPIAMSRAKNGIHPPARQGPAPMYNPKYSGDSAAAGLAPRAICTMLASHIGCAARRQGSSMSDQVQLRCRCGEVRAQVTGASPRTVNRVVCYCDDCQAFAHRLGRADLLNSQGGSDIVQVAPASLTFVQGQHRIVGMRLTPKGL